MREKPGKAPPQVVPAEQRDMLSPAMPHRAGAPRVEVDPTGPKSPACESPSEIAASEVSSLPSPQTKVMPSAAIPVARAAKSAMKKLKAKQAAAEEARRAEQTKQISADKLLLQLLVTRGITIPGCFVDTSAKPAALLRDPVRVAGRWVPRERDLAEAALNKEGTATELMPLAEWRGELQQWREAVRSIFSDVLTSDDGEADFEKVSRFWQTGGVDIDDPRTQECQRLTIALRVRWDQEYLPAVIAEAKAERKEQMALIAMLKAGQERHRMELEDRDAGYEPMRETPLTTPQYEPSTLCGDLSVRLITDACTSQRSLPPKPPKRLKKKPEPPPPPEPPPEPEPEPEKEEPPPKEPTPPPSPTAPAAALAILGGYLLAAFAEQRFMELLRRPTLRCRRSGAAVCTCCGAMRQPPPRAQAAQPRVRSRKGRARGGAVHLGAFRNQPDTHGQDGVLFLHSIPGMPKARLRASAGGSRRDKRRKASPISPRGTTAGGRGLYSDWSPPRPRPSPPSGPAAPEPAPAAAPSPKTAAARQPARAPDVGTPAAGPAPVVAPATARPPAGGLELDMSIFDCPVPPLQQPASARAPEPPRSGAPRYPRGGDAPSEPLHLTTALFSLLRHSRETEPPRSPLSPASQPAAPPPADATLSSARSAELACVWLTPSVRPEGGTAVPSGVAPATAGSSGAPDSVSDEARPLPRPPRLHFVALRAPDSFEARPRPQPRALSLSAALLAEAPSDPAGRPGGTVGLSPRRPPAVPYCPAGSEKPAAPIARRLLDAEQIEVPAAHPLRGDSGRRAAAQFRQRPPPRRRLARWKALVAAQPRSLPAPPEAPPTERAEPQQEALRGAPAPVAPHPEAPPTYAPPRLPRVLPRRPPPATRSPDASPAPSMWMTMSGQERSLPWDSREAV